MSTQLAIENKDIYSTIEQRFSQPLPVEQVFSYLNDPSLESSLSGQRIFSETVSEEKYFEPPIINSKEIQTRTDNFISLQKWEGIVLKILADSFIARLIDLSEEGPDEEAEFPFEEVGEDAELVKPGAIFYWNIGYLDTSKGQRIRSSMIRFRRLPVWQRAEIDDTKDRARQLSEHIGWK